MTQFHRQSLVAYGQPLCETVVDCPTPRGSEVLVACRMLRRVPFRPAFAGRLFRSSAATSRLDITKDRPLPFTLGHEIAGVIEAAGEEAEGATIGRRVAVYPWIGCGTCAACRAGDENMCSAHRHLGIAVDGGYATHVLVPHPRYLIDYAPLPADFAGPLMCSGLTAYAALKRLADRAERGPVLLVGLGGVGMMGLAIWRARCFATRRSSPISMPRNGPRRSPPARRKPSIRPIRRRAGRSWRRPAACSRPAISSARTSRCNSPPAF